MKRYFWIIFFLSTALQIAFGGNLESVKGKTIIIPELKCKDIYYRDALPCVYTDECLKKYKFKDEYLYPNDIFGDTITVNDIIIHKKGKKDETALIVCNHKGNNVVIYVPTVFNYEKPYISSLWFNNLDTKVGWSVNRIGKLENLSIPFFDISKADSLANLYRNILISPVKELSYSIFTTESDYETNGKDRGVMMGRLYSLEGFKIRKLPDDIKHYFHGKEFYNTPHLTAQLKDTDGKVVNFPIRNNNFESDYFKNQPTIESFQEYFITEDSLIKLSKSKLDIKNVEMVRSLFENKEIYFNYPESYSNYATFSDEPTITFSNDKKIVHWGQTPEGYGTLQRIELMPSKKHKPYLWYYAIIENPDNKTFIAVPIDSVSANSIMLADEHHAQVEQKRLTEIEKDKEIKRQLEKEERDYYNSLVRKYGRSNAKAIIDGSVRIGFTKEMCEEAWGSPYDTTRVTTQFGTAEAWWYGGGDVLYFQGNKLVMIQN